MPSPAAAAPSDRPTEAAAAARGREAERPREISKAGWRDIFRRVKAELKNDRVSFISAGIAFYILLGLVPLLGAVVGIYGLVADPAQVQQQLDSMEGIVPPEALALLGDELTHVASSQNAAGLSALLGILLALWGGSKAMDALITGCNVAYDEPDRRNFIRRKLLALGLTAGSVLFVIVTVALLAGVPAVLAATGMGSAAEAAMNILRWPLLFLAAMTWLSLIYRFAPARDEPKWRWVTWGAFLATVLWIIGSALFTLYASNFGSYSKSYGALGAVILLLMWFYLTGFAAMLGAEINAEMEHQTRRDTTSGQPEPRGHREAYVADHLPDEPDTRDPAAADRPFPDAKKS